jgi:hypothetical protein
MTIDEVIKYYGSCYAIYKECGFAHGSPYHWKKQGYIPSAAQRKIEQLTQGVLKAELDDKFLGMYINGDECE